MDNPAPFQGRWHWHALLLCNLTALLLLTSWLWEPTRLLWNQLDLAIFRALNEPLERMLYPCRPLHDRPPP